MIYICIIFVKEWKQSNSEKNKPEHCSKPIIEFPIYTRKIEQLLIKIKLLYGPLTQFFFYLSNEEMEDRAKHGTI